MGVLTDFFRASDVELRTHYASWKTPLSEPRRSEARNPFTGKTVERLEWDPSPDISVEDAGPVGVPGPSIDLKGLGDTSVASLITLVHDGSPSTRELFNRPALIGPAGGPWIHQLPDPFVAKLAKLDESGRRAIAEQWSEIERADIASIKSESTRRRMLDNAPLAYWREVLNVLADFARDTVAEGKNLYLWMSL